MTQQELEQIVRFSIYAWRDGRGVLSTGERLMAALVLNRADWLAADGYTMAEAIERVGAEWIAVVGTVAATVQAYIAQRDEGRAPQRVQLDEAWAALAHAPTRTDFLPPELKGDGTK